MVPGQLDRKLLNSCFTISVVGKCACAMTKSCWEWSKLLTAMSKLGPAQDFVWAILWMFWTSVTGLTSRTVNAMDVSMLSWTGKWAEVNTQSSILQNVNMNFYNNMELQWWTIWNALLMIPRDKGCTSSHKMLSLLYPLYDNTRWFCS